ncbi:MAG: DUF4422 domain-containing protein [Dorea sp.]|nr:DUF4422 domain-containing protein [Dorea sp.]
MDLVIFGAQGTALGAYEAIHNLYPIRNIRCFLVTERGNNAEYLSGVPVLELETFANSLSTEEKEDLEILIATPENMMPEIETSLESHGFFCHVRLTSSRWSELMHCYCAGEKDFMPLRALPVGYHRANMHVFMAKFHKDKELSARYGLPEWITPIQVGAVLSPRRVANILDCDGENISAKNGNYSELTALYWIWKNRLRCPADGIGVHPSDRAEERPSGGLGGGSSARPGSAPSGSTGNAYYGLSHYRRILEFTEDDVLRLVDNGVDVVLPYPMPYEPDIEEHHRRYLKEEDWKAVRRAVWELQPEYSKAFPSVLEQKYLYNYNIILARKEVLAEYCEWLFPILSRVEELSVPRGKDRADRYIGYIAETLETLYFMYHAACQPAENRLNIMHAGCRFLL